VPPASSSFASSQWTSPLCIGSTTIACRLI
jgi:hypothetical protein